MGILGSLLGKRDNGMAYRTIDGGHPAPYPDMTDEQLYNYEVAFNVPHRTFDRPPQPGPVAGAGAMPAGADADTIAPTRTARPAGVKQEPFIHDEGATEVRRDPAPHPAPRGRAPRPQTGDAERRDAAPRGTPRDAMARSPAPRDPAPHPDILQGAPPRGDAGAPPHRGQHEDEPLFDAPRYSARPPVADVVPPDRAPAPPLDFSRPVRMITTRQPVEIITTRARHPVYKVHGYIGDDDVVTVFTIDGRLSENGLPYLENVPQMDHLFLNIYLNRDGISTDKYVVTQHSSREAADAEAAASAQKGKGERLTCVDVQVDA